MTKILLICATLGACVNPAFGHNEHERTPLAIAISADNVSWNCSLARRMSTEIKGSNYYDDVLYLNTKNYVLACPLYAESEVTSRTLKVLPYFVENGRPLAAKSRRTKNTQTESSSKLRVCNAKMKHSPLTLSKDELLTCTYQATVNDSGCEIRGVCPDYSTWLRHETLLASGSPEAVRVNQSLYLEAQRTIRHELENVRGPFIVLVQGYRFACNIKKLNPVLIGANISIKPEVALSGERRLQCQQQAVSYIPAERSSHASP